MSWFKIDDKFHHHPKVVAAGNAAVGLFVRLGSWSAEHLSDGVVPDDVVRSLGSRKDLASLLKPSTLSGPLVVKVDGGVLIPDFLEFNPSRATVLAERAATAERVRRYRSRNGVSNRAPSRPVPTPYLQLDNKSSSLPTVTATTTTAKDALDAYASFQSSRRAHPSRALAYERAIISAGVEHLDSLGELCLRHPDKTAIEIAHLYAGEEPERTHDDGCPCGGTGVVYLDDDDPDRGVTMCPGVER